jgi:hypothetical protein
VDIQLEILHSSEAIAAFQPAPMISSSGFFAKDTVRSCYQGRGGVSWERADLLRYHKCYFENVQKRHILAEAAILFRVPRRAENSEKLLSLLAYDFHTKVLIRNLTA